MAPIILSDYSWSQTEIFVSVHLPLRVKPKDVFTFKNYIKVNAPPYLFELFLREDIDEEGSTCTLTDDKIIFELKKLKSGIWPELTDVLDNQQKIARRKAIAELKHARVEEQQAKRKEHLRNLQTLSVQEQIGLDGRNRTTIEEIKNREKDLAMNELEVWKNSQCLKDRTPENEMKSSGSPAHQRPLAVKSEYKMKTEEKFPIPLVRQAGTIEIHFSSREFPTPTRESLQQEESEFLQKQLAARRATGFVSEDLRPEECNPVWLKNKGDSFHKSENYLGAISAYSHAIKLGFKLPALFSNRAASHMALGNLHKALEDCSTALELLTPHVNANVEARAKAHARRGAILCRLGLPEKSIPEFLEAIKLRPHDSELRADYENAQRLADEAEESDN